MASAAHFNRRDDGNRPRSGRRQQHDARRQRRGMVILISVAVLCALLVPGLLLAHAALSQVRTSASADHAVVPADLFIQSVTQDDGALGWHQLCPDLQAQLPESMLVQQANAQHAQMAQYGITLTSSLIGAEPRAAGGQMRQYLLIAHWPDRSTQQKTYTVFTEPSGCVADISIQ
jgi:hypothetical protein